MRLSDPKYLAEEKKRKERQDSRKRAGLIQLPDGIWVPSHKVAGTRGDGGQKPADLKLVAPPATSSQSCRTRSRDVCGRSSHSARATVIFF